MKTATSFRIKSYTWQELGLIYNPDKSPAAASRSLRRWVNLHPTLKTELSSLGWQKGVHRLTPRQVQTIVHHLGEP